MLQMELHEKISPVVLPFLYGFLNGLPELGQLQLKSDPYNLKECIAK